MLETTLPVELSTQYAASAMWPEGRIAARSFMEMPMTLDTPPLAILISSPSVLTRRLCGELPVAPALAPSSLVALSSTEVMSRPSERSYHSLPMMPLVAGTEPVRNAECPGAVTVGKWSCCASR